MPKAEGTHRRHEKIARLPGFRSLVDHARRFPSGPVDDDASDHAGRQVAAAWVIMDLCGISAGDELFVMNCVSLGVDAAIAGQETSTVSLLVPDLPLETGLELAVDIARKTWPKPGSGPWLRTTQNGAPIRLTPVGEDLPSPRKRAGPVITQGPGVVALVARNGRRIYMDVTHATKDDIRRAIPDLVRLRRELNIKAPQTARGRGAAMDEGEALEAAQLHRKGSSLVNIGHRFGWRVYAARGERPSCPRAEQYVARGEEILGKLRAFDDAARRLLWSSGEPEPR